jgi:hypothetical protein
MPSLCLSVTAPPRRNVDAPRPDPANLNLPI